MKRVAILFDPYHDYATSFIEVLHQVWGLPTVCLYRDPRGYLRNTYRFSELASAAVVGSHWVGNLTIPQLAAKLRAHYDVVAVLPHIEHLVLPASRLAAELGLTWGPADMMRAYRDKYLLKSRIRAAGNVRINHTALVHTAADVRREFEEAGLDRVVLKPNDGFGNVDIGFFDRGVADTEIDAFLGGRADPPFLLEEFIEGDEYIINGQTDDRGRAEVFFVGKAIRVAANGRQNVQRGWIQVPRSDPVFGVLADYVSRAVEATGLRRNPFHAEAFLDDRGPCLIEVAARLCGIGIANQMNVAHAGRLNTFQLAAHYYLSDEPFGDLGLDWRSYDAHTTYAMAGISHFAGRIWRVDGLDTVESMPEFVRWVETPSLGKNLVPTTSLVEMPYALTLAATSPAEAMAADERIRNTIVVNAGSVEGNRTRGMLAAARATVRGLPRIPLVIPRRFPR